MKHFESVRAQRNRSLPTVLLTLALAAGFASVGHADEIPQVTTVAKAPLAAPKLGNEMQATADTAVAATLDAVAAELDARLKGERRVRIAARGNAKRG